LSSLLGGYYNGKYDTRQVNWFEDMIIGCGFFLFIYIIVVYLLWLVIIVAVVVVCFAVLIAVGEAIMESGFIR